MAIIGNVDYERIKQSATVLEECAPSEKDNEWLIIQDLVNDDLKKESKKHDGYLDSIIAKHRDWAALSKNNTAYREFMVQVKKIGETWENIDIGVGGEVLSGLTKIDEILGLEGENKLSEMYVSHKQSDIEFHTNAEEIEGFISSVNGEAYDDKTKEWMDGLVKSTGGTAVKGTMVSLISMVQNIMAPEEEQVQQDPPQQNTSPSTATTTTNHQQPATNNYSYRVETPESNTTTNTPEQQTQNKVESSTEQEPPQTQTPSKDPTPSEEPSTGNNESNNTGENNNTSGNNNTNNNNTDDNNTGDDNTNADKDETVKPTPDPDTNNQQGNNTTGNTNQETPSSQTNTNNDGYNTSYNNQNSNNGVTPSTPSNNENAATTTPSAPDSDAGIKDNSGETLDVISIDKETETSNTTTTTDDGGNVIPIVLGVGAAGAAAVAGAKYIKDKKQKENTYEDENSEGEDSFSYLGNYQEDTSPDKSYKAGNVNKLVLDEAPKDLKIEEGMPEISSQKEELE